MDYKRNDMKFIRTTNAETADKLRYEGFTQLPSQDNTYLFLKDGKRLVFDVEQFDGVYTNIIQFET